jgi:hypothetical protein
VVPSRNARRPGFAFMVARVCLDVSISVAPIVRKGKRRASASLVLAEKSVRRQELGTVWLPNARELRRLGRGPPFAGVVGSSNERA